MEYVGIQTQQSRNNNRSVMLLVLFPVLVLALVLLFFVILYYFGTDSAYQTQYSGWDMIGPSFVASIPWVMAVVLIWFLIAYFSNTAIIRKATHARPLDRKENKRVYNLVENLCMSQGMPMPKINVIDDGSLNAFASGINKKTYTVTLTTGIIEKLDDRELEAVIAHELSHIRNHDVRLLIVSIVFVGIFAMVGQVALRAAARSGRGGGKKGGAAAVLLVAALLAFVGYGISTLMRFAISRNREYMADAGSAEMTKNPDALAAALRKISGQSHVEAIEREDVAQLFIEHPLSKKKSKGFMGSLFATHPPIDKRIEVLEQF